MPLEGQSQTELTLDLPPAAVSSTKPAAEPFIPTGPTKFPKVYSYPGIVSLTGEPMPEKLISVGDWEFLFNGASSSRQLNRVVLRPLHLRVLFALCSFARENYRSRDEALEFFLLPPTLKPVWLFGPNDVFTFNCSMRALWRRMGNSGAPSVENRKVILSCLEDMTASPIRLRPLVRESGDDAWIVRKLVHGWGEDCEVTKSTPTGLIKRTKPGLSISVSKNLLFLIERQYSAIHLDVFNDFTSDLARMIYLHYVPRAAGKPSYARALPKMYEEFGLPCPKQYSRQVEPLTRKHAQSPQAPIEQLNGARTLYGILHAAVRIGEGGVPILTMRIAEPKIDLKAAIFHKPGVLLQLWLDNDRTREEWAELMKRRHTLRVDSTAPDSDPYVAQLWPATGIGNFEQYRDPIEMGIAVIGMDRFREIIGVIASHEREGRNATKSRLHQLVYEIKEAVTAAAKN